MPKKASTWNKSACHGEGDLETDTVELLLSLAKLMKGVGSLF